MAYCLFHPERQGIGICIRCRVAICPSCCTRMDGINYCHACLKALGERPHRPSGSAHAGWAVLTLAILGAAYFGIFWLAQGSLAP